MTQHEVSRLQKDLNNKNRIIQVLKQTRSRPEFKKCIEAWKVHTEFLKAELEHLRETYQIRIERLNLKINKLNKENEDVLASKIAEEQRRRITQIQKYRKGLKNFELKVLNCVKQADKPPYLAEIAAACDLRKNTTWYVIDNLRRKGYVFTRKRAGKVFCYVKSSKNQSHSVVKNRHSNEAQPNCGQNDYCSKGDDA